jgi:hypothetical protein
MGEVYHNELDWRLLQSHSYVTLDRLAELLTRHDRLDEAGAYLAAARSAAFMRPAYLLTHLCLHAHGRQVSLSL